MKKNKRGISLIVLVVTIIVMVVLASAIIVALKNNNIITFSEDASEDFYNGVETEKNVLSSLLGLIEEKLPNKNDGQGSDGDIENPNVGSTQEEKEEFLKTKLLAHDGDAAIDEEGNIMDLSLWNIETYNDGHCRPKYIPDPDDDKQLNIPKYSPAYKGNIVNGEFEHNIPAFVKKSGEIYKLTIIGSYVFNNLNTLTTVKIPFTVEGVDSYAFRGCSNLEKIIVSKMSLIEDVMQIPENCNPNALVTEDGVNGKTLEEMYVEYWENFWD